MIHTKIRVLKDGYSMLEIHPRLSLCYRVLKKAGKGGRLDKIQCAYFGFDDEQTAKAWLERIRHRYAPTPIKAILREGDRLTQCSYEVKLWEFESLMPLVMGCARQLQEVTADAA